MDIKLELKWLYSQYKKGFGSPPCWDVEKEEKKFPGEYYISDPFILKNCPIFRYNKDVKSVNELSSFLVIESSRRCLWFTRNNVDKYIDVCNLGDGDKIEIDGNRLIEMRTEIINIIGHVRNKDYGMASIRAELLREKLNKLI